jgi:hypothetical protein
VLCGPACRLPCGGGRAYRPLRERRRASHREYRRACGLTRKKANRQSAARRTPRPHRCGGRRRRFSPAGAASSSSRCMGRGRGGPRTRESRRVRAAHPAATDPLSDQEVQRDRQERRRLGVVALCLRDRRTRAAPSFARPSRHSKATRLCVWAALGARLLSPLKAAYRKATRARTRSGSTEQGDLIVPDPNTAPPLINQFS